MIYSSQGQECKALQSWQGEVRSGSGRTREESGKNGQNGHSGKTYKKSGHSGKTYKKVGTQLKLLCQIIGRLKVS